VTIDGQGWNRYELRNSVARNVAFAIGENVRLGKITRRDAAIILASNGASPFTVEQHSRAIAAMIRNYRYEAGSMSAYI
jgi:hypothetical protein